MKIIWMLTSFQRQHLEGKSKHISIAFHQAREAVAAGIALIFYETSRTNHADLFTKVMNHIDKKRLMGYICGKSLRS